MRKYDIGKEQKTKVLPDKVKYHIHPIAPFLWRWAKSKIKKTVEAGNPGRNTDSCKLKK